MKIKNIVIHCGEKERENKVYRIFIEYSGIAPYKVTMFYNVVLELSGLAYQAIEDYIVDRT